MTGPHQGEPVEAAGAPLSAARAAVVLVHGRGATAGSMLTLADAFGAEHVAYRAPQADGFTWYPHSFLSPIENNEPWLSSALQAVGDALAEVEAGGVPPARTVLLGFSQGACLALEYAARHPQRYGGVVALSGGLLGTGPITGVAPPHDKRFDYDGHLGATPVFLGCSDVDAHIPVQRVRDSTAVFKRLGADVTERIYPGMGHTVNGDEVAYVRGLLAELVSPNT